MNKRFEIDIVAITAAILFATLYSCSSDVSGEERIYSPDRKSSLVLRKAKGGGATGGAAEQLSVEGEAQGVVFHVTGAAHLRARWVNDKKVLVCYSIFTENSTDIDRGYVRTQAGAVGGIIIEYVRKPDMTLCDAAIDRIISGPRG